MSLVLVLDFDGTVTQKDVGDEICDRFAPPEWRDIDAQWVRHELSLPEAQRRMWGLARAGRDEAIAYACSIGHERPGLDALLARVKQKGGTAWLASGGFDFYIEAILGKRLAGFERVFFNTTRFIDGRIEIDFPHAAIACEKCAVCKGNVCDLARSTGARVIFVGDGSSDRCVAGRADEIWAVEGSLLARHLDGHGVSYHPFRTLDEVAT